MINTGWFNARMQKGALAPGPVVIGSLDPQIRLKTVPNVSASASATTNIDIELERSNNPTPACSVAWDVTSTLASGRFQAGQTFSGTISFAANEIQKYVRLVLTSQPTGEANASYTITLSGASGCSISGASTATGTITMPAAVVVPVANDDTVTVNQNGTIDITIFANDTNYSSATLSYTQPSHGTTVLIGTGDSRQIRYTPTTDYLGSDSFTYTLTSGGNSDSATVSITVQTAPNVTVGPLGARPQSAPTNAKLTWWTGSWEAKSNAQVQTFWDWRGMDGDAVTHTMKQPTTWPDLCFCSANTSPTRTAEEQVDYELGQSKTAFAPTFTGTSWSRDWRQFLWSGNRAAKYRSCLLHLNFYSWVPTSHSNASNARPTIYKELREGLGDKYLFLLGRKFAWKDANTTKPARSTLDFGYEFGDNNTDRPAGSYTVSGTTYYTSDDYGAGWLRSVKAFKLGYAFQAGISVSAVPWKICWRPQQQYKIGNAAGTRSYESMFPDKTLAQGGGSDFSVPSDITFTIGGSSVVIMPSGALGRQIDFIAMSSHDNVAQSQTLRIKGLSAAEAGNNWALMKSGNSTFWGLQRIFDFCKEQRTASGRSYYVCFPEWSAYRDDTGSTLRTNPSTDPGGVMAIHFDVFSGNPDVFAYETIFDFADGDITTGTWSPTVTSDHLPGPVYKAKWY